MGLDPQMVEELQDLSPEELHKEVRKFGMLRSNFMTKKHTQETQKQTKNTKPTRSRCCSFFIVY